MCIRDRYLAVTGVPFLSTRLTVTPVPVPVNDFSGTKVTVPSGATVYVPSPGITLVVEPSSNVAGTSSSIGTLGLPSVNLGLPVCVLPWISVDVTGSAVGVIGVTVGVYLAVTGAVSYTHLIATKIEVKIPRPQPNSGTKRKLNRKAPSPSTIKVVKKIERMKTIKD